MSCAEMDVRYLLVLDKSAHADAIVCLMVHLVPLARHHHSVPFTATMCFYHTPQSQANRPLDSRRFHVFRRSRTMSTSTSDWLLRASLVLCNVHKFIRSISNQSHVFYVKLIRRPQDQASRVRGKKQVVSARSYGSQEQDKTTCIGFGQRHLH